LFSLEVFPKNIPNAKLKVATGSSPLIGKMYAEIKKINNDGVKRYNSQKIVLHLW
jgi:hypothetical protein